MKCFKIKELFIFLIVSHCVKFDISISDVVYTVFLFVRYKCSCDLSLLVGQID